MVTVSWARQFALSFEEAMEQPHFEKTSFRVRKKIFATLNTADKQVVVKFTAEQQSLFGLHNPAAVYPVSGGWGKQGYTVLELSKVRKEVFNDAVTTAYCNVAPAKLANKYNKAL